MRRINLFWFLPILPLFIPLTCYAKAISNFETIKYFASSDDTDKVALIFFVKQSSRRPEKIVVNKQDFSVPPNSDWIGGLLEKFKAGNPTIFQSYKKEADAPNFTNNATPFQTQSNGFLTRIRIFRRFEELKPTENDEKSQAKNLVSDKIEGAEVSPEDFIFELPTGAKVSVQNLVNNVNDNIRNAVEELAANVEKYFEKLSYSKLNRPGQKSAIKSNWPTPVYSYSEIMAAFLTELIKQHNTLQLMTETLANIEDRAVFFDTMVSSLALVKIENMTAITDSIIKSEKLLQFFERVLGHPIPLNSFEWIRPFEQILRKLEQKIQTNGALLNSVSQRTTTPTSNQDIIVTKSSNKLIFAVLLIVILVIMFFYLM